jgi:hypothetical protein
MCFYQSWVIAEAFAFVRVAYPKTEEASREERPVELR